MTINNNKSKLILLINELVNNNLSEEDEKRVCSEIDSLSLDPLWSDYIYWSNDYLLDDNSLDIDKLVDKITKTNEM